MMSKILYRDDQNAAVFGVCKGLADYFEVDVSLVRILTLVSFFFSVGTVFLVYFIMGLVLPSKTRLIREGRLKRRASYSDYNETRRYTKKEPVDEYEIDPDDYKL